MLDQVALPRPLRQHVGHELARGVELVVAREDHALELLLVVALADQVAVQDVEPALPRPDLFPQVGGGEALGIGRVAGAARTIPMAAVERQEHRGRPRQPCGHHHLGLADREMHERPAREAEQRLQQPALRLRVAVEAVLVHRVVDGLCEVGLQLHRGHREAVEEQHQVQLGLRVVGRVRDLPHHAQAVGLVVGARRRIQRQRRLELGQHQRLAQAQHLHAPAQHVQRAALVQALAHPLGQHPGQRGAVGLGEARPGVGLGGFDPGEQVGREQAVGAVELRGVTCGVEPAVGRQMRADLGLEVMFSVQ